MEIDEEQLKRLNDVAKQLGIDTSEDSLDKIMAKLDLTKKPDSESIESVEKPKK